MEPSRDMVKQFNAKLRDRVNEHKALQFLDFFEDLLDEDGSFKLEYALDGTHMNSLYCTLLEKTLVGPHKIDTVI